MKRLLLLAGLAACTTAAAQDFTYDDIAAGRLAQRSVRGIRSMADGEHYTVLQEGNIVRYRYDGRDEGTPLLERDAARPRALALTEFDPASESWREAGARALPIVDYRIAADGRILLAAGADPIYRRSYTTHYYLHDANGTHRIMRGIDATRDADFSPDGEWIAFSSGNNLYLYNTRTMGTRQITRDGAWNRIINGTTDWVYEEEFGFTRAFAFSPDSRRLAYLRFDESEVPLFEMMRYDGRLYNRAFPFKYPKSGDRNATVTLWVHDIASGRRTQIDTGSDSTQYIPRIGWTPDGRLWYLTRNRRQNEVTLRLVEADGSQRTLCTEKSPTYVAHKYDHTLTFLDDGDRFVTLSETPTGWAHLYLHSLSKGPLGPVTSGQWEVCELVAATRDRIYYTSTERSPLRRNLYSVRYDGRGKRCLTPEEGYHTIAPSEGMKYFISTFSTAATPSVVKVCRADGRTVRTLEENRALRRYIDSIGMPRKEFVRVPTERGDTLNGYIVRPEGFDPAGRYPVLMTQYSGPGSQQVADRWSVDWEDALVQQGYVVFCVDGRGTGFRGERFKKLTYGQLGRYEVEDQLSAARWIARQEGIDPARIGIYGWSYGGFMALSCACKGDGLFRTAIAVAPVTSWAFYDTIYSELYNGLPQENPEGFERNAPIHLAPLLRDDRTRLLLIHGTADDNVHFQNSVEMIRALSEAGKTFDLMIYPDQNHSMAPDFSAEVRQRMLRFTLENL